MAPNILITGAAGYIGGSILSDFLTIYSSEINKEHVHAAVRTEQQAKDLSELGIKVHQIDLTDESNVADVVIKNHVSIVIQTASSLNPSLSVNLLTALGKQKQISREQTYFVHKTSGISAFYEKSGWPSWEMKDDDQIFAVEKQSADSYPIRKTDIAVIEHARALGVTSFIVIPTTVYGEGNGVWNRLSIIMPPLVQASLQLKRVYKFAENTKVSGVHITDLTALYWRITQAILQKEDIPDGEEGYYFAKAHTLYQWDVLEHLAKALKQRAFIEDDKTEFWPSDGFAAQSIGVPEQFLEALWKSGDKLTTTRAQSIGWKPQWDETRFLENINDEINAVLKHEKAKSSLVDSLFAAAGEGLKY
ncbi:hypothetical protein TruAng_002327 [Truncatella angustata]|nr:hypothetical protein TruAng_002327 [Truncatella angustata]